MRVSYGTATGTRVSFDGTWAGVRFDHTPDKVEIMRMDGLKELPSGFTNADVQDEVRRRYPDVAGFSPELRGALADEVKDQWYTALPCGHTTWEHVKEFGPEIATLMETVPLTILALVMGELDDPESEPLYKRGQRVVYRRPGQSGVFARIHDIKDGPEYVISYRDGGQYMNVAVAESDLIDAPLSDEEKYGR